MLREIPLYMVRQIKGEHTRRWFTDEEFDLIVWVDERGEIVGFQLRYDKQQDQRAVTWHHESGFMHNRVDDGENRPGRYKLAPIPVPDGLFQHEKVAEAFRRESIGIEEKVATFVYEKLMEFPTVLKDA